MSRSQSHQHPIARPINNPFVRERSPFVSSPKKQAEQRPLSFHQAGASDRNSIPIQTEGRFVASP
jgi:hypothetical protein